jgi:hypothetical protein
VEQVKSFMDDMRDSGKLPTIREFEGFLRDAGFSNSQSKAIASRGLGPLLREVESGDDEAIDVKSMLAELTQATPRNIITIEDLLP